MLMSLTSPVILHLIVGPPLIALSLLRLSFSSVLLLHSILLVVNSQSRFLSKMAAMLLQRI
jgi:hypothetical protein